MNDQAGLSANGYISTYLIAWPKVWPLSLDLVQEYFLQSRTKLVTPVGDLSAEHAAAVILDLLRAAPPNDVSQIRSFLESDEVAGLPVFPNDYPVSQSAQDTLEDILGWVDQHQKAAWEHAWTWWETQKQKMDGVHNDFYVLEIDEGDDEMEIIEASGVLRTIPYLYAASERP